MTESEVTILTGQAADDRPEEGQGWDGPGSFEEGGPEEAAVEVVHQAPAKKPAGLTIRLVPSQERLERMKTGILMKLEDSFKAQCQFLARFMVNSDGTYMDEDKALDILSDLPLEDTGKAAEALMAALKDLAAPK